MMMQAETATATRRASGGRSRYLSFGRTDGAEGSLSGRSRVGGAGRARSLRASVGSDPSTFMRRQRQPDGE